MVVVEVLVLFLGYLEGVDELRVEIGSYFDIYVV